MAERPTIGELYKGKVILEEDLVAAVDAFMVDPSLTAFPIGTGYTIDLAEAVCALEWASVAVSDPTIPEHLKRQAVRTAILLARPVKG